MKGVPVSRSTHELAVNSVIFPGLAVAEASGTYAGRCQQASEVTAYTSALLLQSMKSNGTHGIWRIAVL